MYNRVRCAINNITGQVWCKGGITQGVTGETQNSFDDEEYQKQKNGEFC